MILPIVYTLIPFVVFAVGALVTTALIASVIGVVVLIGLALLTRSQVRRIEAKAPPRGRFVAVSGARTGEVRMHVLERGREHGGRPVVLLHGAASNADDIMTSAGAAFPDRHVIAIDRPGHGYSERPSARDMSSPIAQSTLVKLTLDALNVRDATFVGHSWGACLAATMALRFPELVSSLVLMAPVSHPWRGKLSWYWRLAANPVLGPVFVRTLVMPVGLASLPQVLKMSFTPNAVPEGYAETTGIARILRPSNFKANAEDMVDLWANVNWLSSQYGTIETPTIILQGTDDPALWKELHAESLARQMPDCELRLIDGIGHMPNYFAQDAIADAVDALEAKTATPLAA